MTIHDLPALNASLNALSTVLLVCGYALVRTRRLAEHRACMLAALTTSALFLVCYIVYHAQVGSVRFTRQGLVRPVYFTVLITHVTLAATVLPLALITATRALKGTARPHRAMDVSDLAVRVSDRRSGVRPAVSADVVDVGLLN